MTINVTREDKDLRERLFELDDFNIPYEKFPKGACLNAEVFHSDGASNQGDIVINTGNQSSGYTLSPAFTYYKKKKNSLLFVQFTFQVNTVQSYTRQTIHFDHLAEDAYTSRVFMSSGNSSQASAHSAAQESKHARGVIGGYVFGPSNVSTGTIPANTWYYNTVSNMTAFLRYESRFVSLALVLATDGSLRFRDDRYSAPKAIVMEFAQ